MDPELELEHASELLSVLTKFSDIDDFLYISISEHNWYITHIRVTFNHLLNLNYYLTWRIRSSREEMRSKRKSWEWDSWMVVMVRGMHSSSTEFLLFIHTFFLPFICIFQKKINKFRQKGFSFSLKKKQKPNLGDNRKLQLRLSTITIVWLLRLLWSIHFGRRSI